MPILDTHAHIFPPKIAEKASRSIGLFYNTDVTYKGSIGELIASGDRISVTRYIVHSTATRAEQVIPINDFIIRSCREEPRFIGFGTMHQDFPDIRGEFERMQEEGLKGLKLHPDFQEIEADSPRLDPVYEELADRDLPVLIHAGDSRYDYSSPRRLARVLDRHPRLKMIAAHFGGYTQWEDSLEYLAGRDCWFDTSSSLWRLSPETAGRFFRKHGTERFLFGSDFPMWDHTGELKRLDALQLGDRERDGLLWDNGAALLNLPPG